MNWKPGGKVFIAGSAPACANNLCTIAAVNSSSSMTIQENAGTLNGANFKTANSGVKLWVGQAHSEGRSGSGTATANISVNFDYAYSDDMSMPLNGTVSQCSPVPTTVSYAADGVTPITPVPGQLCLAAHNSGPAKVLYLLIPSTGETRLLAPIWFVNGSDAAADQVSDPVGGSVLVPDAAFDATDPNTLYVRANTKGGVSIFRGVYSAATNRYKAYAHSLYPSATASYAPGQDTTKYWYRGPAWADTGLTWTNINKASQGLDLGSQIAANDPNFAANLFHSPSVTQISQGQAITVNYPMSNASPESLALIHSFNLSTGKLAQTANTWSQFPNRWCAMHSNVALEGWYGLICNPLGGEFGFANGPGVMGVGPWQMTPTAMLKNGSFSPDTSMTVSAPQDACPAIPGFLQALMPANPRCVTYQSQMACSKAPYPGENVKWPCEYNPSYSEIQPLAPGDGIMVLNGTNNPEFLLILSVTSLGNFNYQFTAVRAATRPGYQKTATGWTGIAMPPSATCSYPQCTPGVGMWFGLTQTSVNWMLDPGAFEGHSDLGNAPTPGANSYCQSGACRFNIPFTQQIGTPLNIAIQPGSFQGVNVNGALALQGYPSLRQLTAPPSEQSWMANFRHINPSFGSGAEVVSTVGAVSYSLVPGTQGVFKFTAINGGVSYKNVPVEGYAGYHLLQDSSGPAQGNTITDATPWQFCVVLKAGECRTGSNPGEGYASVPQGAGEQFAKLHLQLVRRQLSMSVYRRGASRVRRPARDCAERPDGPVLAPDHDGVQRAGTAVRVCVVRSRSDRHLGLHTRLLAGRRAQRTVHGPPSALAQSKRFDQPLELCALDDFCRGKFHAAFGPGSLWVRGEWRVDQLPLHRAAGCLHRERNAFFLRQRKSRVAELRERMQHSSTGDRGTRVVL